MFPYTSWGGRFIITNPVCLLQAPLPFRSQAARACLEIRREKAEICCEKPEICRPEEAEIWPRMDLSDDDFTVTAKRGSAGNNGDKGGSSSSSSSKPSQSTAAVVLLNSSEMRRHAKVCRSSKCSQCGYHKQQVRLESQTPMLVPSWGVNVLNLSAEQQLLARGSWLQPAICNGTFG